jgi:photosystem II stability/assembly factor-like uncharacterized protein
MLPRPIGSVFLLIFLVAFFPVSEPLHAGEMWQQIGPFGGDVRTLASSVDDLSRLYLGTKNGQIYVSTDHGQSWSWLSQLSARYNYVIDALVVDSANPDLLYVGAYTLEVGGGGGVFRSTDAGRTWQKLPGLVDGESVRALAQGRTDPRVLVAGSLSGVFRSRNAGKTWDRISPAGHEEIRNIHSVAIDPRNPDVIYAGTFHLPWKTEDGGATWKSIKTGMIDDSDVFSIVIDWNNPGTVYASACSGIYKSDSAGKVWRKIQGIPHTARRTRVLKQDPHNARVIYAGTTEGLWKTETAGDSWRRLTSPRLIINDIAIDPRNPRSVLLGTDRAGVLVSSDGGENFVASNTGFVHRKVSRVAYDADTGRLFAAVLADKEWGGVFVRTAGQDWEQIHKGIEERDITALIYARTAEGGRLLGGYSGGVLALDPKSGAWTPVGRVTRPWTPPMPAPRPGTAQAGKGAPARPAARPTGPASAVNYAVYDFFQAGPDRPLYAATSRGVLKSEDAGVTWAAASPTFPATTIAAEDDFLVAGSTNGISVSFNGGGHWFHVYLPRADRPHVVNAVAMHGKKLFVASDAGLYRSMDGGARWEKKGSGVPTGPIASVRFHPQDPQRVFATARSTGIVYASEDGGESFRALPHAGLIGGRLRGVEVLPRRDAVELVVASGADGLFVKRIAERAAPAAAAGVATGVANGN